MIDYAVHYQTTYKSSSGVSGLYDGVDPIHIFNTLQECKDFLGKFITLEEYRIDPKKYSEGIWLLKSYKILKRIVVFEKKNFKPRMRCPIDQNNDIVGYEMHGTYNYKNIENDISKGCFCYSGKGIKEIWDAMKHKNVKDCAKIHEIYLCEKG